MPAVSVIVRSFNEAEYIGETLDAVTDQAYQDFEIILVDSGSTDGTLEIAEEYVDEIAFVDPRNFTFGYSLNVGCGAASGEYCVFLSAHAIPTDDRWLGTLVENLHDENVAMAYSNQTGAGPTKFSEDRLFDRLFPEERRRQTPPDYFANNASSAIKRELWKQHIFDEYLTGHEDIEWAKHFMEQGYEVVYEPEACIYHIHDETWEQVYRRFEREAIADREIGIRDASERWAEYLAIPRDVVGDIFAAARESELGLETAVNVCKFRYYQHTGTANGLQKEQDLEADRYEYFYPEGNRQIKFEGPDEATITTAPLPEIRPNDVLIEVDYVGVAPHELAAGETSQAYPVVPGREYVGTVVDLGANVDTVSVGDQVTGGSVFHCGVCRACNEERYAACKNRIELGTETLDGALTQFLTVPSNHVHRLPDGLDAREATLAGPLSTIVDGISRASPFLDDRTTKACVVGDGFLRNLTTSYLNAEGYDCRSISDPLNSHLDACNLVVLTSGIDRDLEAVFERIPPGSVVVLLETEEDSASIPTNDVAEKVLVTVERRGERHMSEALTLLDKGDYDAVLHEAITAEEFIDDPSVVSTGNRFSLVTLGTERFHRPVETPT